MDRSAERPGLGETPAIARGDAGFAGPPHCQCGGMKLRLLAQRQQ